jgi:RNA polymerase sigma-70 factor (ECF subfamily)
MTSIMSGSERETLQTRASLVAGLQAGEEGRWQEFYGLYGPLIRRFALKTGLTEIEADEVVQETAIALARHLPEFRYDPKICRFKTWLLNQTAWRVKDQLKKRHRQEAWIERGGEVGAGPASTDENTRTDTIERLPDSNLHDLERLWETEWKENLLAAALQRVKGQFSDRQFQMFDLNVLKGWSAGEVAESLGVSLASVYLAKHRVAAALKKERARLERGAG